MYVEEVHGGSSDADYMYFIINNELVHVSQLPGVRRARVERWGRSKKRVTWEVPDELVAGAEGLYISFTRKGYPIVCHFKLSKDTPNITFSVTELYMRSFIGDNAKDPIREAILKRGLKFKLFGQEKQELIEYRAMAIKLVDDMWKELRNIGINDISVSEHAERTCETLKDPVFAEYMSLILPTPQGRVRSLYEKKTRTYELWLLLKLLRALYELGARPHGEKLWISYTTNEPAIKMTYKDRVIHVLYQPSIAPHIAGEFIPLPKPFHVIPDVAVVVSDEEEDIGWGRLSRYSDKIPLLVEAKLSLSGVTAYETVDMAIRQVEKYRDHLDNRPSVIVAIYHENRSAVFKLESVPGVRALDNVNPDNPQKVREFMGCVKEIIEDYLSIML